MNTSIVNNKVIFSGDKTYFVIWRQKGGRPIPVGKGSHFTLQQRADHNRQKAKELWERTSEINREILETHKKRYAAPKGSEEEAQHLKRIDNLIVQRDKAAALAKQREDSITELRKNNGVIPKERGVVTKPSTEELDLPVMKTDEERRDWGSKNSRDVWDGMNERQVDTVMNYQIESMPLNSALRQGRVEGYKDDVATLDGLMRGAKTKEDVTVYRGMFGNYGDNLTNNYERIKGTVIVDKAFASTSLNANIANEFSSKTILKVGVPKGSRALYLSMSPDDKSHEVLLPRNSKFKITGIQRNISVGGESRTMISANYEGD